MTDRTTIRRAMAMLSGPHRAVIYQAYYFGRTTAEIAAELRTSEREVRAELHDAMLQFRRNLRDAHVTV